MRLDKMMDSGEGLAFKIEMTKPKVQMKAGSRFLT
jgi:hypothetical protein